MTLTTSQLSEVVVVAAELEAAQVLNSNIQKSGIVMPNTTKGRWAWNKVFL
jgi:hypothetical protein